MTELRRSLITQKREPSDFQCVGTGRFPWLLLSRSCSKDVVLLPFVHLYSTLLPQVVGDRLKPHRCASRESHPSEDLSELPPLKWLDRSIIITLTRSLRNGLSCCFVDGWVPLAALLGRLLCGKTAQAGLGASSRVALRRSGASSGNVFQ